MPDEWRSYDNRSSLAATIAGFGALPIELGPGTPLIELSLELARPRHIRVERRFGTRVRDRPPYRGSDGGGRAGRILEMHTMYSDHDITR